MSIRRTAAALTSAAALSVTGVALATPASAQPLVTGGLVNVTVSDSLNNVLSENQVSLGAALGVAANVCDVNVNVLARQLRDGGATCTSTADGQRVDITQMQ